MKIAKVEIQGFKSFADRLSLRFDNDVSAIVGPNGCGKSNISDAVRWAMGEQSMKKLRGSHLEDVIFAGSETRGPQSMAEVEITFDNTDGLSPPAYQGWPQIVVRRRFFRDGTSEYAINKEPCRLRDIKELFMGTGVGGSAYSMIEQGRIGWIVTSRPEDKRKLIEEAAGVTAYKAHKLRAERQMDRTRQNLDRVNDRIAEIERNLSSLKRQAQKARRYQKYRQEMVDCELHIATHRWLELDLVRKHLDRVRTRLEERKLDLQGAVTVKESEVEDNRGELLATEMEHGRLQESLYEENNRITLLEGQVERGVAELANLRERADAAAEEHRRHGERREELGHERGEIEGVLGEMEGRLEEELRHRQELETELERCRERYDRSGRDVERIGELVVENARRRSSLSARMDEIGRLLEAERGRVEGFTRARADLEERLGRLEGERAEREGEIELAERERRAEESLRAGMMSAVGTFKRAIKVMDGIVEADAEALSAVRSRLEVVEERIARKERQRGPVKLVQEASRKVGGEGLSTLAESLTCREGYEAAVAAALEQVLDALVVERHEDVVKWSEFARTMGERIPGFVTRRCAGNALDPMAGRELAGAERAIDLVDARPEDGSLVERLLVGTYVVPDLDTALALHRATWGRAVLVTLDGTVVGRRGEVTVRDEERGGAPLMQLEAEAARLRRSLGQRRRRFARSNALHQRQRDRIAETTRAVERSLDVIHDLEMRILTMRESLHRFDDEEQRVEDSLEASAQEMEIARVRIAALEEELRLGDEAMALRDGEARGLEARHADARELAEARNRAVEAGVSDLRAWEVVVEGHARERERVEQRLAEVLRGQAEAEGGMERARLEMESNSQQQGRILGELFTRGDERDGRLLRAQELRTELDAAKERFEDLRLHIDQLEGEVRARRRDLDALTEEITENDKSLYQVDTDVERAVERALERTGVPLEDALVDHHKRPMPTQKTFERRDELHRLIERMGHVNIQAIADYEESVARHEELTTDRDDIQDALDGLEKAIAKLNRECRRRFKEAFHAINEHFQQTFPKLFEGGKGRLELTDESDLLESGVEIYAQPPGKRLVNLSAMSGGEKALTAVALIFAMFRYRPSPFCFLDEVDAPLDDVNVSRFMEMLRGMTDRSQFILVTHKKITMESSDFLYGVTMEEPGITKIVSVRLAQAKKLAEPAEDEAAA